MLKNFRKTRLEEKLQETIEFNNIAIKKFQAEGVTTFHGGPYGVLCWLVTEKMENQAIKLGVCSSLINEAKESERVAEEELDKMRKRFPKAYQEKQDREKIDLIKQAIKELKEEGVL